MKKILSLFTEQLLSKEQLKKIKGGYEENPMWDGCRYYRCTCPNSSGGAGDWDFIGYMCTTQELMDASYNICGNCCATCS
jgi:hypothetical protein